MTSTTSTDALEVLGIMVGAVDRVGADLISVHFTYSGCKDLNVPPVICATIRVSSPSTATDLMIDHLGISPESIKVHPHSSRTSLFEGALDRIFSGDRRMTVRVLISQCVNG